MKLLFLTLLFMTTDTATKTFTMVPLPYDYTALAPEISEETLHYHHDKHYATYVAKLNELVAGTPYERMTLDEVVEKSDGAIFNNAAQAWNHEFYFDALSPAPQHEPEGALRKAIDAQFGSFDKFKEQMTAAATSLFSSGWVWLVEDKTGHLSIFSAQNADNPLRHGLYPLFCIDVWEHAYYIDYRNARADSVKALWNRVDWKKIDERYDKRLSKNR